MDVLSFIFLAIFLFFAIFCCVKGFLKSIIYFAKGIVSFLLAIFLCRPLAGVLMNLPTAKSSEDGIISWLNKQSPQFSVLVHKGENKIISEALKSISIPSFLSDIIGRNVAKSIPNEGIILSETVANSIMYLILCVISFVLIIIATRIVLSLLRKFIKNILNKLPTVKKIDRIIGLILGAFIGIVIIDAICFVFMGIMSMPGFEYLANNLQNTMKLEESTFTISKLFYEHNILLYIFS